MMFKMYNCDFGFKLNDVSYDFQHVDSFAVEDPTFNRLVRGSNATNKEGLIYTEGTKEPKTVTVTILGMPTSIKNILAKTFAEKKRLDSIYAIDRTDGSSKIGRNAILCQEPIQLMIDESQESMNVSLVFQTFDLEDNFKSE